MAGLTRFVLAHKRLVAAAWLIIALVAVVSVSSAVGALSQDFGVPGREGAETSQAIIRTYGNGGTIPPLVPVVSLPPGTTVVTPGVAAQLTTLFEKIQAAAPQVRVASFTSTGDRAFVSTDGRTTFGLVYLPKDHGAAAGPVVAAVRRVVAGATIAGAPVRLTGYDELQTVSGSGGSPSLLGLTLIGGLGALVVLAWVFGSFVAVLPLLMAAIAILTTFLLLWGLTAVASVSSDVQYLVALIGLGVAIDYALLIVTRWREERAAGQPNEAAVRRAMATAGRAVVFSGTTVGIGLCALVVLPVPFLRSFGYGGVLIPLVSVLVAITLLPVLLATVGPRLDWPLHHRGRRESRVWLAWARLVVRQRWPATAVALLLLLALAVPAFSLTVGDPPRRRLGRLRSLPGRVGGTGARRDRHRRPAPVRGPGPWRRPRGGGNSPAAGAGRPGCRGADGNGLAQGRQRGGGGPAGRRR